MITSTTILSPATARVRGFTLVEVMVAATLGGFVLLGVTVTNLQLMRSSVRITQYAEMDAQVRRALEQFGHDAKIATDCTLNSASDLTLTVPDSSGATTQVTYAWTSATQSLFRVPGASSAATAGRIFIVQGVPTLAGGGAGLTFTRYDRDGAAAATNLATKRIQVTLTLKRTATTAVATTQPVSATFLLRNKPTS